MATAAAILAVSLVLAPKPSPKPDHAHHRSQERRRLIRRAEPYRGWTALGGWSRYAIPAPIVQCESRGDVHEDSHPYSSSGEYQIEASTWAQFGGLRFASLPYEASKLAQSIVARRIWRYQGPGAWTCAYVTGWL